MAKPEDFTVLVVDDEPDIRAYLRALLEDAGLNVETAQDGEEALEKVKEKKPDFISLDLVMPKKSGIRFFYELRKNKEWSRIPVVIVTGHAKDEKVRKEMDDLFEGKTLTGPRTYLEKPVKPEDYVNMVKRELGLEADAAGKSGAEDDLKYKAKHLLETADKETLERAIKLLSKEK